MGNIWLDWVWPLVFLLHLEALYQHAGYNLSLIHILEAAELVIQGVAKAIIAKRVTGDFSSEMENATQVGTAQFGEEIIANM